MIKNIFEKLKLNPLFGKIEFEEFDSVIKCTQGTVREYKKDDIILLAGNPADKIGIILTGCVRVVRESEDGRVNLLTELCDGEIFGEVFACAGVRESPVTVTAATDCAVFHMNYKKVITTCSCACAFHQRLIENMLALLAGKNLMLNRKIEIISKRTIRERLMTYFSQFSGGKKSITLPYSREELAAFLCTDRSALSAELSKMHRDGLINYSRNNFEILY